ESPNELGDSLRTRRLELEPLEHEEPAVLRLRRERAAQREAALLARHVDAVRARMRPEDDTAAFPLRRSRRTLASPSGPLLAVGFAPAAAHVAACLGRRGALTSVGELADQRLVHHRLVRLDAEDRLGELHAAGLGARLVDEARAAHACSPIIAERSLSRIMTTWFLCPGTDPCTSSRLRSVSTRTTSRLRTVIWVAPCWPAILRPLNTRAASVEPIEPACLMLCDPCDTGPRWKLWRLCCPENPLPWLTP